MQRTQTIGVLLISTVLVIGACTSTTTTPPPETVTVTPPPATITITPPAITATVTLPATTVTVTPTPSTYEVEVSAASSEYSFHPLSITVPVGATITWTNTGLELHTVTSDADLFNEAIAPGESFSFTFTEPGTYYYHCEPHAFQSMIGQVAVE